MALSGGIVSLFPAFPSENARRVMYATAAGLVGLTSAAVMLAGKRYVYVCMYVCMCVCICVCVCVHMGVNMQVSCVVFYIRIYAHVCIHTYTHTYMHIYMIAEFLRARFPVLMARGLEVATYIHIHVHTYIHIHDQRFSEGAFPSWHEAPKM